MSATIDPDALRDDLSRIPVLPGMSAWEYLELCRARFPALYRLLRPGRLPADAVARTYAGIAAFATHFETKLENGRG
ncbi:MAG TPA: hypothetical protein VN224_10695, partial [Xanthomonadales bacterium]|nr:hypothetical protein [Xanthomonadales bacterium]